MAAYVALWHLGRKQLVCVDTLDVLALARRKTSELGLKMAHMHSRASMLVVLLLQLTRTAAFSRQRPYSNYNLRNAWHNCNLKPLQVSSAIADVSDGWLSPQQIKTLRKEIDDRRRRKRLAYKRLHDGELAGDFDQATLDAADAALASSEFF